MVDALLWVLKPDLKITKDNNLKTIKAELKGNNGHKVELQVEHFLNRVYQMGVHIFGNSR